MRWLKSSAIMMGVSMSQVNEDGMTRDQLFLSLHLLVKRCLTVLGAHTAYAPLMEDCRSVLRLTLKECDAILAERNVILHSNDTEH